MRGETRRGRGKGRGGGAGKVSLIIFYKEKTYKKISRVVNDVYMREEEEVDDVTEMHNVESLKQVVNLLFKTLMSRVRERE